jgi:sugar phosphate isomerase/epimerase
MKRREFLIGSAATASLTRVGRAQDSREAKLAHVSIMSGGFGRLIPEVWDRSQPVAPKELDIMDVPQLLGDRFGIHHFEVQQIHFLSMEPSYYTKFNEKLKQAKCKMSNMPLELDDHGYAGIVGPSSPDPALRARAIDLTKKWIDIAAMIGCPSVMVNQGTGPLPEDLGPCIETLKTMAAYGKSKNVAVTMENRGRATPKELANLIKASGTWANPDLGNFPDEETRARGMRLLIPLAHHQCHVKMNPRFDFAASIRLAKELGFKGIYSIEGGGPDPNTGVPKILEPLLENM